MTFSARSLARKPSGRAAVPLIGDEQIRRPDRDKNRSGEADATCTSTWGIRITAEKGAGLPIASAAPSAATSARSGSGAESRRVRFTW